MPYCPNCTRIAREKLVRRLHGVLAQAYWHRQGFRADEMLLDEDGDVIAVRLPERFKRLAGACQIQREINVVFSV